MTIRCRFVDSISVSPTVRLDLNAMGTGFWLGRGGLRCPPPSLRYAAASTLLTDGALTSASAYDNRTLTIPLSFSVATMDDRKTLLSALFTELNRERNILEYRHEGSSTSYFFRTIRSSDLDPAKWYAKQATGEFEVTVEAEPFAYGLRQTLSSSVTVGQDPAGSVPYVDVTPGGDVETPLIIRYTPPGSSGTSYTALFAVRRHGTPSSLTAFYQAGGGGTDTTATADALWSGGSKARTTFATASMTTRWSMSLGTTNDMLGTYRVYVRHSRTGVSSVIQSRLSMNGFVVTDTYTHPTSQGANVVYWLDMGLIQIPRGGTNGLRFGLSDSEFTLSSSPSISVDASRTGGTDSLDSDYAVLVPADEGLCVVKGTVASTSSHVIDGVNEFTYTADLGGSPIVVAAAPVGVPTYVGRPPLVAPGQTNRLFIMSLTDGQAIADTFTFVSLYYYPRYLAI